MLLKKKTFSQWSDPRPRDLKEVKPLCYLLNTVTTPREDNNNPLLKRELRSEAMPVLTEPE